MMSMKMKTRQNSWMNDIFEDDSSVIYFHVLLPSPLESITRLLDNLGVSEETFIVDLVRYVLDEKDNPFINTLMEIPSYVLVDGPDLTKQSEGIGYTIQSWYKNSDFSELEALLGEIKQESRITGVTVEVVSGRMLNSYLFVEFELVQGEGDIENNDRPHRSPPRMDGTVR